MQVLLSTSQQPEQLPGPQGVPASVAQALDWQSCELEHVWHAAPPLPHADDAVPGRQVPVVVQQPSGQLEGPQLPDELSQRPEVQVWVPSHVAHATPNAPHAVVAVPS
jgi:hypothetical protein